MWVRSQDKKALDNVKTFQIVNGGLEIWSCRNCNTICLGVYSTEQKALKVLDMIQEHLYKTNMYDTEKGEYERYRTLPLKCVFQMPQDSEV